MEQLKLSPWDASRLLHKGNKVSLFVVNPFGFLSSPIHADRHWTLASGGYSTEVWSPQKHGAHIPRKFPNSRACNTGSTGTPKQRSVTLGCKMVLLSSSGTWGHTRPWDTGGQQRVPWVKMTSSYSHGRTTTETFFLGQVKWPQWSSVHSKMPTRKCYCLYPGMWLVSNEALFVPVYTLFNQWIHISRAYKVRRKYSPWASPK